MKRLTSLFCILLAVLSVVGCASSVVKERCNIDLKAILKKTYIAAEVDGVKKGDVVKQKIIYNEVEDKFYVEVIVTDELVGTVGDRVDDLLSGKRNRYDSFCYWYIKNIRAELDNKNIDEEVVLKISNKSESHVSYKRIK